MSKDDKEDVTPDAKTPASVICIRCKKESSYFSETVRQHRYKDSTGWLCDKCVETVEPMKVMTREEKEKRDREYDPTEEELRTSYKELTFSIEKIRTCNKIILECMKKDCPDFVKWLDDLSRYGVNPVDGMVLRIIEDRYYRVHIFTERHCYSIRVKVNGGRDYLACESSQRQPLTGETWTRGRDLPDGSYNRKTWDSILAAIVSCELVRLGK